MAADIEQAVLVRVSTSGTPEITKLAGELEKLKAQAQSTASGAAPLGTSLSSAGGGADKLTSTLTDLRAELGRIGAGASELSVRSASLTSGTSAMAGAFMTVLPAAIGTGAAISALRVILGPLAEAAGKAEESQIRLAAAVQQAGSTIQDQAGRIAQAAKQTAGVSIFDETSLRNAAALFTTITGNASAAESALQPIVDLSAALGIGLEESARMVARAGEGMVGSLGRAGIVFSEIEQKQLAAASSSDRLALVFAKIEEKAGGAAAAQLNTYAGSVAQVKKSWDDLKETLGNLGPLEFAKNFFIGVKVYADLLADSMDQDKDKLQALYATAERVQAGISAGEVGATRGKVGGLYAPAGDFSMYGISGDEANKGIQNSNALAAALAKVNEQAVATKQTTDSMFRDIAKMQLDIDVGFKPPETDPIKKAIEEVADWARKKLESISDKEADLTNKIASGLAAAAALQAETTRMKTSDNADQSQITANQRLVALILQQVTGYRQGLDLVQKMPEGVNKTADAASKLAEQNAMAKAFEEAQKRLDQLNLETDRFVDHYQQQIGNLPTFLQGGADAFLRQLEQMRRAATQNPIAAFGPLDPEKMDAAMKVLNDQTTRAGKAYFALVKQSGEAFAQVVGQLFDEGTQKIIDGMINGFQNGTSADFRARIESLLKGLGIEPDTAAFEAMAQQAGIQFSKAATDGLQRAVDSLAGNLSSIFVDVAATGGKNFGEISSRIFQENLGKGLQSIFGQAILGALGGKPVQREGESAPDFQARVDDSKLQQARVLNAVNNLVGGIGQTLQIFQNAKKGQETSVLGGVVGGAVTGASVGALFGGFGAIIGAIAGALVGGITAALANSKAKKEQPYAAYGIRDGQAYVESFPGQERQFENVTNAMKTDMLQRMNSTLEETSADYIKLLLKFPVQISSQLALGLDSFDFAPTMSLYREKARGWAEMFTRIILGPGVENYIIKLAQGSHKEVDPTKPPGEIGNPNVDNQARRDFLSDFDNWVKNTLPHEIAEHFRTQTSTAFTAMGMTLDRFNEIWDKLQGMDPKDALDIFNNIADALIAFGKVTDQMAGLPYQFQIGLNRDRPIDDQTGLARQRGVSDFQQSLMDAGDQLLKLGMAIFDLPLKDQAAAAAQLGQNLDQLRGSLVTFLNTLIEMSHNLSTSIAEARFNIKLDQATDPNAKKDLLLGQLRTVEHQINMPGANPADVQRAVQQSMDLINRIYQIDPTKYAAWADAAYANLDKLQKQEFDRLGKQATDGFQQILDGMKPVLDFFKGLDGPLTDLATSATNATNALNNFSNGLAGLPQHGETSEQTGQVAGHQPTGRQYGNEGAVAATVYVPPGATPMPAAAPEGQLFNGGTAAPTEASAAAMAGMLGLLTDMDKLMPSPDVYVAMFNDLEKVVSYLTDMDQLMPAPEVYTAMLADLDQLVADSKLTTPTFTDVVASETGGAQPAGDSNTVDREVVKAILESRDSTQASLAEMIAQISRGADSQSAGQASLAERLDTAVTVLVGILGEIRNGNAMPAPMPEVRVIPVPVGSGQSYRQGAVTRRLNARQ